MNRIAAAKINTEIDTDIDTKIGGTKEKRLLFSALVFLTLSLMFTQSIHAQMHKYVDANGKIFYSDKPPPSNAKKLETKVAESTGGSNSVSNVILPSELAAAVSKNPVVFYATATCPACDGARSFLKQNGIPFSEIIIKTEADIAKLKQDTGDSVLPVTKIGKGKFNGHDPDTIRNALTAGGYPATSILPKDYRYPAAVTATPAPVKKEVEEKQAEVIKPRTTSTTSIRF
jgi:glutaredoxin